MLIKEYRIPLPMSVDEYRIAQLYMIQVSHVSAHVDECGGTRGFVWKSGGIAAGLDVLYLRFAGCF